jgi:hypothetical protein
MKEAQSGKVRLSVIASPELDSGRSNPTHHPRHCEEHSDEAISREAMRLPRAKHRRKQFH